MDVICAFIEDRLDSDWCNVIDKPFDCISKRVLEIGPEMLAGFDSHFRVHTLSFIESNRDQIKFIAQFIFLYYYNAYVAGVLDFVF